MSQNLCRKSPPNKNREAEKRDAQMKEAARKQYLLSIAEHESTALSGVDRYDRIRYLRQQEAEKYVNEIAMRRLVVKPVAAAKALTDKPVREYKEWAWDDF